MKKAENFEGPSSSEGNHITPTNCKIFLDVVMRLESLPTDSKNNRDRAQEGLRRRETKEPGMVRKGKLSHSFFQDCDESHQECEVASEAAQCGGVGRERAQLVEK